MVALVFLCVFLFAFQSAAGKPAPNITTPCGRVSGVVDTLSFGKGYAARYSLPYALPPIGDLRWRPPAPPVCPWTNTFDGTFFPNVCVNTGGSGSEDCLYLTVMVPISNATSYRFPPSPPLPVVVYFHGGNLIGGSAPGQIPRAEMLANLAPNGGLILVTVAYRLNTLGWLATKDLAEEQGGTSGNYGLMDAIAALQWIQKNIASFGGDSNRVNLLGQSSGGTLIFALLASPNSTGLYAGAISLSGSPNITQNVQAKWAQDQPIVDSLGNCSQYSTSAARLACLRQISAAQLGQATPGPWRTPGIMGWLPSGLASPSNGGMNYAGIVYVDGKMIPLPFHEALAAGINANASLVLSNMAAEGDGGPPINVRNQPIAVWNATVAAAFSTWPNADEVVSTLLDMYSEESAIDPQLAYDTISADYGLTCGNLAVGLTAVSTLRRIAPTYLLYNAWPSAQHSADGKGEYPAHGLDWAEIGYSWPYTPPAPSDIQVSQLLQKLVSDYAYNYGVMPEDWNWPALRKDSPPSTLVIAQQSIWPNGGVRAVANWKVETCNKFEEMGLSSQYWWCD